METALITSSKNHETQENTFESSEAGEAEWEFRFVELERFYQEYNHVRVPNPYPPSPELPLWLATQKTRLADLSRDQIRRLWELGVKFPGTYNHRLWFFHFFKLVDGKERYGDANDERIWQDDPQLKKWVEKQRSMQKRLLPVRRRLLAEIGFTFSILDAIWEKRFKELLVFKARFGHCRVPSRWAENSDLGEWLSRQRSTAIDPQRKERLVEAGAFISHSDTIWEKRFQQWCEYLRKGGTPYVSDSTHRSLSKWAIFQRFEWRNGIMSAERIRRLEETGFIWDPLFEKWERRFQELERFRQIHGHCNVVRVEGYRSELAAWCSDQAWYRRLRKVSPERIARLDALGFIWNPQGIFFEEKLKELKRYRTTHGHSHVPNKENLKLAQWMRQMRQERKKERLSPEQIRKLDGLIEWNPRGTFFEEKLKMLKRFHAKHGHTRVGRSEKNLAKWIGSIRIRRKKGRLSAEQIQKLDGLIDWNPLGK